MLGADGERAVQREKWGRGARSVCPVGGLFVLVRDERESRGESEGGVIKGVWSSE